MKLRLKIWCFSLLAGTVSYAQVTPGAEQDQSILLLGGYAHLGTGEIIKNSAVGFENGMITLVQDATLLTVDEAPWDTIIDITGKHIYPGFIAPNSTLGLQEIGAVRATRDHSETGAYNPNIRSIIAYNTDSHITPTIRTNGVLMAQITPRGGVISGSSSVVVLDAWNWEDAVIRADDGIHLNWPRMIVKTGWWAEPGGIEKSENYDDRVKEITAFFQDAKAYNELKEPDETDLRFESMAGLFDGSKTLYVHADGVKEITAMYNFVKEFKISKVVLIGGYDSYLVTDLLIELDIAVMIRRTHDLPMRPEDDIDHPYKLPALLSEAGVLFCLENSGDMEQMNTRNLPFLAGTAVTYGLDKEDAIAAITLNTAKILGVDDQCGSIEEGKDATLFVSEGDALDMLTNNVTLAFVQGRMIELTNHQIELYEKYDAKYELMLEQQQTED